MSETEQRLTSADIKKQIEEAKAKEDLKNSGLPLNGQIANEINATGSTPKAEPKAESKPQETSSPAEKAVKDTDFQEWAKKKGIDWTTDDTVLAALHKSDQAFHRKRQEDKVKEEANRMPPQYSYSPPVTPPAYVSPAPQLPRATVEHMARLYNVTPEDFERMMLINRDFFEAAMQQERQKQNTKFEAIERENKKNSVFRELSLDPVFRKPQVAIEYHNVVESMQNANPQLFEEDPNAYKSAYEKALANIARRDLEGQQLTEGVPPMARNMIPTSPPKPLGQGSGGGSYENESAIDPKEFARLSVEDKKKVLLKMGLVQSY